jgi:hypothetical protein
MAISSLAAEIEEHNRNIVQGQTWGHLYPKRGEVYRGRMVLCFGQYGNMIVLNSEWEGLGCSPVLYEVEQDIFDAWEVEEGNAYVWVGSFSIGKNGKLAHTGELSLLSLEG